jgi:hypothetical protein
MTWRASNENERPGQVLANAAANPILGHASIVEARDTQRSEVHGHLRAASAAFSLSQASLMP